jgi:hypothetical protein
MTSALTPAERRMHRRRARNRARVLRAVGRRITRVDLNPFDDGRGGQATAPVLHLDDGTRLRFDVQETESLAYGVECCRDAPSGPRAPRPRAMPVARLRAIEHALTQPEHVGYERLSDDARGDMRSLLREVRLLRARLGLRG